MCAFTADLIIKKEEKVLLELPIGTRTLPPSLLLPKSPDLSYLDFSPTSSPSQKTESS